MCMRTKWILLAEFQRWDGRLYAEIIWNLNEFLSFWVLWNFVTISKLTIEFFVIRLNQLFQKWKQTTNQRSGTKQKLLFYSFTIAFCCGYQFLSILENTNFVCGKLKENVYSKDGSERAIWSTWLFLSSKLWDARQILGCQIKRDTILVAFFDYFSLEISVLLNCCVRYDFHREIDLAVNEIKMILHNTRNKSCMNKYAMNGRMYNE